MNKKKELKTVGGKAKNLFILKDANINVPPFFVVSTTMFEEFMNKELEKLDNLLKSCSNEKIIEEKSEEIQKLILSKNFEDSVKDKIFNQIKEISTKKDVLFSVRSSAVDEDGKKHSFAGMLSSFLYIKPDNSVFENIKKCFASAYSKRVMLYRFHNKIPLENVRPAVIVQKMIFGEKSGVVFTGNPLNNNPDEILINISFGIGEGIVSGELDSDIYVVDTENNIVKSKISTKKEQIVFDKEKGFGLKKIEVPQNLQKEPCIKEKKIFEIVDVARKIEKIFDYIPQDIEFCIENNQLYILQSRAVTVLSHIQKNKTKTIFDNSNIIESFPGTTSPLTFSLASMVYDYVYRQFYEMMGTSKQKIASMSSVFRNMLGYIDGKIYYNLNSWYRTIKLLPGYNLNKEFMEKMMGVNSSANVDDVLEEDVSTFRKIFIEIPYVTFSVSKLIFNLSTIKYTIKRFIKNFYKKTEKYLNNNFKNYSNHQLISVYDELFREILFKWKAPIINDFKAMVFYGVLSKKIKALNIENSESLQNDLLIAVGDLESTKPTKEIIRISKLIKQNSKLKSFFDEKTSKELSEIYIKTPEKFQDLEKELKNYIKEYGSRSMNELKLEIDSIKEDPEFLFTMLKNYVKTDDNKFSDNENQKRQNAEKVINKRLQGLEKKIFYFILNQTRQAVKDREELRFMRTKIFGILRAIFNQIGRNFEKDNFINHFKDIYFLKIDEVFELIEGRATDTENIKLLIEKRKEIFEKQSLKDSPERIVFYGSVCNNNFVEILSEDEISDDEFSDNPDKFKGVACSPGTITNKVKIILSPKDASLNGEIVVAKRTDPGWVPLFPSISGLIIERGSVLSHSAVVAREMGIPTIVGLRNITEKLNDGDLISMNGTTGIIEILERNNKNDKN